MSGRLVGPKSWDQNAGGTILGSPVTDYELLLVHMR